MLNLKAGEKRNVILVALNPGCEIGHDMKHELLSLVVNVIGINKDFANIGLKVIADGADNQTGLLVNKVGTGLKGAGIVNGLPELQKVIKVPLQFSRRATNARCAGNNAHARRKLKLVHGIFKLLPVFTLDAARYATAPGIVGHQHKVAAGNGNKRRKRRPLVATLFLFHLNQELGTF